jgi:hypothetical protein
LETLIVTWEAADRICGKRLKAVLPDFVEAMERHNHLKLDPEVRQRLLSASASTIDRLLKPVRKKARPQKKKYSKPKVRKQIPVRTFSDWDGPPPGYLEIDFVVHCGGTMAGSFINTLAATDICSGWVEGQAVKHSGDQDHWEFNGLAPIRWLTFPWHKYIDTSLASGAGLSYTTQTPKVELRRRGDDQSAKLLTYLMIELAFTLP